MPTSAEPPPIRIEQEPSTIRVLDGERLLLEYRHGDAPWKVHVRQLCTPSGLEILRDSPADHQHHRGLMLALGVDEVDFWGEQYVENPGRQRGGAIAQLAAGAAGARRWAELSQPVDWLDGEDALRLRERRTLRLSLGGGATVLTWRSRLELPPGKTEAKLWGRHYFGLGMRFVVAMDRGGRFVTPDGEPGEVVRGDERLARGAFCAYTARIGERDVTVAMFDHPDNPRPATWFTMAAPFAYLAATLDLERQPIELRAGEPLALRYGVALWDGVTGRDGIAAACRRWITETADQIEKGR